VSLFDDFQVAVTPRASYARLVAARHDGRWLDALERPFLYALLVGTCVAIAATGQASFGLIASTTAAWSWVVVVQLVIALAMTRGSATGRTVSEPRAFELWFAGHVPWTLWMLVLAPAVRAYPALPLEEILFSMLAPIAWTSAIAAAYGRTVLGRSTVTSWLLAMIHPLAIVGVVLSYVAWSAGGWFRLVGP
jgi:hypothetical protein